MNESSTDIVVFEERLAAVERELARITRSLVVFVVSGVIIAFVIDIFVLATIPMTVSMIDELLEGIPIPGLTLLVIRFRLAAVIFDIVLVTMITGLAFARKLVVLLPAATAVALLLVCKAMVTAFAMKLPLIKIMDCLGA